MRRRLSGESGNNQCALAVAANDVLGIALLMHHLLHLRVVLCVCPPSSEMFPTGDAGISGEVWGCQ